MVYQDAKMEGLTPKQSKTWKWAQAEVHTELKMHCKKFHSLSCSLNYNHSGSHLKGTYHAFIFTF